jgi:hypothetical protein
MMKKTPKLIVALTIATTLLAFTVVVLAASSSFDTIIYQATSGGNVSSDGHFILAGAAGQHEAGRLSGDPFVVNGGVIPELLDGFQSGPGELYLPNLSKTAHFCAAQPVEQEPNDTLAAANVICPGETIQGAHDGTAGTGDVFRSWVTGGPYIQIDLEALDANGVQLLLYKLQDGAPVLLSQDAEAPFQIIAFVESPGAHYVYVYSDPGVNNKADYSLTFEISSGLTSQEDSGIKDPQITPPPISR